jgi:hypothetical protein
MFWAVTLSSARSILRGNRPSSQAKKKGAIAKLAGQKNEVN